MNRYAMSAALLSLLLAVSCADRAEKTEEKAAAPAATQPAGDESKAPAAGVDQPPARADEATAGARATTGTRVSRPATSRPAPSQPAPSPSTTGAPAQTVTPAAPAPRSADWRDLTIPQGTVLPLELEAPLSSETAQVETPVRARLKQALVVDGLTALPAGAVVTGEVTEVERAGRVKGRSRLAFVFSLVQFGNVRQELRTNPVVFVGEASTGEDVAKIGAGAVGGAIVGGILGGGEGAAKGAVIGGAAGTGVVLATRGKEVKLASGADIAPTLAAPLTIRVALR